MAEFVQRDHEPLREKRRLAANVEPQNIDARFLRLLALSFFAFTVAVLVASFALLRYFFPQLGLGTPSALDAINWPAGLTTFRFLAIVFSLLGALFYLAALWQILNNRSMQASAGCPNCLQNELMRVSRTRADRLLTFSGVRVARYQCRQCQWNGRRIFRRTYHPLEDMPNYPVASEVDSAVSVKPRPGLASSRVASPSAIIEADAAVDAGSPETAVTEAAVNRLNNGKTAETAKDDAKDPVASALPEEQRIAPGTKSIAQLKSVSNNNKSKPKPPSSTVSATKAAPVKAAGKNEEKVAAIEDNKTGDDQLLGAGVQARIMTTFGINLKAQPRTDAKWVGLLGPDTLVTIKSVLIQSDGTVWYYVESGEREGWVPATCLDKDHLPSTGDTQ